MYTINDARREIREMQDEGYSFDAMRIFINDLRRGRDITEAEARQLMTDLMQRPAASFGTL